MPFVTPSLDEMYKEVLAWDLYHMLDGQAMYSLRDVPVRFSSIDEYLDVFEPLLLEECRAQTLRSMCEVEAHDYHLKLTAVEPHEPFRLLHFQEPPNAADAGKFFDTDLVFVSYDRLDLHAQVATADDKPPHVKGQQFHALALVVDGASAGALTLKVYLPEEPTNRLPPSQHKRLQLLRKVMVPDSGEWYVRKLGNMVTINREFQALYSVRELALSSMILAPGCSDSAMPPPSLQPPPTLLRAIETTHNPSQLLAIRTCLCGRGVTLIQGPPGTGKTKTILGILSVLLASHSSQRAHGRTASGDGAGHRPPTWPFAKPRGHTPEQRVALLRAGSPWLKASAHSALEDAGEQQSQTREAAAQERHATHDPPRGATDLPPQPFPVANVTDRLVHLGRAAAEAPPKHVLVCAPSNAAIDEIVARLLRLVGPGMLNERGEAFTPSIVRVGPNVKESLLDVALDHMAKKRMALAEEQGETLTYDAAKALILNEAAIVCTTLSCAGYSIFSQLKQGFDTVLIDEAAQAVEMSTLIPLKYACRRLILVGDPNQLPATVFSDRATKHNYEQSLFQRLQIGGQRVAMLTTQYRMHPEISRFPGRRFYDGALRDAPRMAEVCTAPWHSQRCLGPYVFYDVSDGVAVEVSSSWYNDLEAHLAMHITRHLLSTYPQLQPGSIGIISPYNGQVRHIRRLFAEQLTAEVASKIEVNSVDGFQGREKDVIVLSCVRSDRAPHSKRGIGFLKDARRMNVSITRARTSVFVLGHAATLKLDSLWEATLRDATQRKCLVQAHSPIGLWFEAACKEPAQKPVTEDEPLIGEPAATTVVQAAADASPTAARLRGKRAIGNQGKGSRPSRGATSR